MIYSFLIYIAYHRLHWKFIGIPFLPIGTIGTAVAFYLGLKNNASYERLWEARKVWGGIGNLSRAFGTLVVSLPEYDKNFKETLVRRQIAWCNLVRLQLREVRATRKSHKVPLEVAWVQKVYGDQFATESVEYFLNNKLPALDLASVKGAKNPALQLLQLQTRDIASSSATLSPSRHETLLETLVECIKEQGAAERIKNFPFPRQYAYFSGVFVWIFLILLPFGLIDELTKATGLGWLIVPFSTLISWIFITMEQVGDSSEDPFEMGINDVPLNAICRNIEIDLLQLLGETEVPEPVAAVGDILL